MAVLSPFGMCNILLPPCIDYSLEVTALFIILAQVSADQQQPLSENKISGYTYAIVECYSNTRRADKNIDWLTNIQPYN